MNDHIMFSKERTAFVGEERIKGERKNLLGIWVFSLASIKAL